MPMEIYVSMMCLEPIVYLEMETYTSLTTENTKEINLSDICQSMPSNYILKNDKPQVKKVLDYLEL